MSNPPKSKPRRIKTMFDIWYAWAKKNGVADSYMTQSSFYAGFIAGQRRERRRK